ncbi:DUF2474 domain-containing protein [Devosia pacifica]|nr:DUF2474 domain-containing protein [Devosia pacifica]
MNSPKARNWLWFAALWLGGVGVVTLIGLVVRLFLAP